MVKRHSAIRVIATILMMLSLLAIQLLNHPAHAADTFKPVPVTTLSLGEVWQRQQVILTLEITTPDEFARLEVEELDLSDFEVIALPFERKKRAGSQSQYTVKVGWILFPLVSGHYEIELPEIAYRPNSGRKIKLKIPSQRLTVRPLPSYIPATMPIGKIAINSTLQKGKLGKLHDTQTLLKWDIELITTHVLPQTIPPILRQAKTSTALDIFPETLNKSTAKTYQGLQNTLQYKVPIKALKSGLLNIPTLSIQYFDPADFKLKRAIAQAPTHWVLNPYIQWFLLGIVAFSLLSALIKVVQLIRRHLAKRQLIRHALHAINQANNTDELRNALRQLSQAKGWKKNATLQQILADWEVQHGESPELAGIFQSIQLEQFAGKTSKAGTNIESLKKALINSLKSA